MHGLLSAKNHPRKIINVIATNNSASGLTLIEVLIALAIIGIAMLAIIKATSENIRATIHLQNKTIAMWVGQEVINEAQVGLLSLPEAPDTLNRVTNMLGRNWYWRASQAQTANPQIKKTQVSVFIREGDEGTPLIRLESYVYTEEP